MTYETNWRRIILAYLGASLIAGALFIAGFTVFVIVDDAATANTPFMWDWQALKSALGIWGLVSMAWLLGQSVLISPLWYLLHISGRRGWLYAVGLGVTVVPITTAFLGLNIFWGYIGFASWGGVMGWITWRIAYTQAHLATP